MQNTDIRESIAHVNGSSRAISVPISSPPPVLSYDAAAEGEDKVHLLDYWRAIRKHLWLVCGITLFATMAATIYLVRKPDLFEAQALVQVDLEEVNPALGAASKNNAVIVNNTINDPAYFNTQLRLLTSTALLRRVVKTLDLENNHAFLNRRSVDNGRWWQRFLGIGSAVAAKKDGEPLSGGELASSQSSFLSNNPATLQDEIEETRRLSPFVKDITKDLRIEPVVEKRLGYSRDSTRLIEILFIYPDSQLASKIVNNIADVFVLLNLERKAEANVSTGNFLQKRVAELQAQIRGGEERLINYSQNHQILSLNAEQNTVVERLVGLNRQLLDAENKRKLAEAAYQAAQAPEAASAQAEETASRQLYEMQARLADARQRYSQLLVENTDDWPEVREAKQQVLTLEEEINRARNRSTNVVLKNHETQYRQALATEQALRKSFDQQRRETLAQNEAAINYRIIQQEIETNKNLLDGLLQRYKENDVVLAGMRNNIHVIDYALPSEKPIGPRRVRGILLALLFSLVFSGCLAIFLEYLNNTVRTPEDVERTLHLPVLVSIPTVGGLRNGSSQPKGLFDVEAGSVMAESYRQLRTAVLLSTPGAPPRRLLVTSCLPSEGKTTTAVNLAVCLAQTQNAKVLIIDADMRRPRLRRLFKLTDRPGLSSYLSSDMDETDLLSLVTQHEDTGLYVLTSGPVPPNPAELLSSEQMRRMLDSLERHFTHIIIDSPPGASFTDAVLISSMVDGVLMVVHSGKTPQEVVRRLRQLLSAAGGRIFGVVLNQVDMLQNNYYYYSGHYQQNTEKNGSVGPEDWKASAAARAQQAIAARAAAAAESEKHDHAPVSPEGANQVAVSVYENSHTPTKEA